MAVKTLLTPLTRGKIPQSRRNIPERYKNTWAYKNENNQFFLGTFSPTNIPSDRTDKLYVVEPGDISRPDLIAYKFYGNPTLYWIILWLNGISDPFEGMYPGSVLRIPSLQRLAEYGVFPE